MIGATTPTTSTLPWSWYEDPAVARLERDRIFRRAWQYAGRRDELTAPGSYAATHVAGLPVVLTRDRDDVIRAFANVCRHRGAIVASGAGERGTLQCPYHAWTYGLDGCLRAAPRTKGEPGFPLDRLGLVPLAVGEWGPFVFTRASSP
jgi:phenylpropionate dioxygenase-like ring-hydroxylating dioxygenase large terminal subunit